MAETVFARGRGGTIFEMDVPTGVHAVERYEQAIEKGDLVIVDASTVEKVELPEGVSRWQVKSAPAEATPTEEPTDAGEPKAAKAK